ncbi:MAG: MFS transporter [Thermoleophilia bacterium]
MRWAFLSDAIALYPVYALLFADHGLSDAQISGLFTLWVVVGLAAEIPTGVLADLLPRRMILACGNLLAGAAFAIWVLAPGTAGFALGFVCWGIGESLFSGAFDSLLYDGLDHLGTGSGYTRVLGRAEAASLLGQVPAGLAASPLFAIGGYALVGAASVAVCLVAAATALTLPEPPRPPDRTGFAATLRDGIGEVTAFGALRSSALVVAAVLGLEAIEEYDGLLAHEWGVPTTWVPLAIVWLPLAGAAGAAIAHRHEATPGPRLALALAGGVAMLVGAGLLAAPPGVVAMPLFYAVLQVVRVVATARMHHRIAGPRRATIASTAEFLGGVSGLLVFAGWAVAGLWGAIAVAAAVAVGVVFLPDAGPVRRPGSDGSVRRPEWGRR